MMDTKKKTFVLVHGFLARRLVAIVTPRQRCARWGTMVFTPTHIGRRRYALIRRMRALPVDFH